MTTKDYTMAHSLKRIIGEDGAFTRSHIHNLNDALSALECCYWLIAELSGGDMGKVSKACNVVGLVDPYDSELCAGDMVPKPMQGRFREEATTIYSILFGSPSSIPEVEPEDGCVHHPCNKKET